jgi:hypothetical protein
MFSENSEILSTTASDDVPAYTPRNPNGRLPPSMREEQCQVDWDPLFLYQERHCEPNPALFSDLPTNTDREKLGSSSRTTIYD